jgi:hypothetical protein
MMDFGNFRPNKTGILTFMIGVIIGFAMFLVTFLQDTEAIVFSALSSGEATLRSFSCPEIITASETGTVRAKIHNSTPKKQYRTVRTDITQGFLTFKRDFTDHYYLDPDETLELAWEIYPEDAAYGYLILVKVYLLPQRPLPSYIGACGVMVLDIPLIKGWHLIGFVWLVSAVLMAAGFRRYLRHNQPLIRRKRSLAVNMAAIAATVVVANATVLVENWYLGLGFFLFTWVLIAESIFSFSQS